jgi:zinc protease
MRSIVPALALALATCLALGPPAVAQDAPAAENVEFDLYRLDNGLTVILAPDPSATVVAVNLWYDVGSRHERPGRSGFAHLFEHLMFQGSENVARGEHMQFIERAGGSLNATVNEDRTIYFQTVPPDRYNLALWLEADRMRALTVTFENMKREVEVVKEERRMRYDNAPYGNSQLAALYYRPYNEATCFPYAHSPIGSMEDLDAAELQDVQDFFDLYYAPNNATLTLVGLFDAGEARGIIEEYFGGIEPAEAPPGVTCEAPFDHLPVEEAIVDGNAQLPAVWAVYGGVEVGHADSYALSLLSSILGQGESSRLNQRLVQQDQIALGAGSGAIFRRDPGLLLFQAIANQGVDAEQLRVVLEEEITRIQREGVTADELEKAKNRYRASTVLGRQTVMGLAQALQWHNFFLGDPRAMNAEMDRHMAVTAADIHRVANEYLQPGRRLLIFTLPATQS